MKPYKNISGSSGVKAFEAAPDYIDVVFVDGTQYHYSYKITGVSNVEQMKQLAEAGKGLSGYISKYVRDRYEWRKP